MKRLLLIGAAVASAAALAEPAVTAVSFTQNATTRAIEVAYTLTDGPAVITADVQTNAGGTVWDSIGERNFTGLAGDVNRKVASGAGRKITWHPMSDAPDPSALRFVVTAWSVDNPPDYMVVDLAQANAVNYYVSTNALPGGLFGSDVYRTTKIVLRKVKAAGTTFLSGTGTRQETVQGDFYIGIFPVTQGQYVTVGKTNPSKFSKESDSPMRPVETVSFSNIRGTKTYPTLAPVANGWLDLARSRTGVAFDLPGSSFWEYAARAGRAFGQWGDGTTYGGETTDSALPGRYRYNGGYRGDDYGTVISEAEAPSVDGTHGTSVVGLYPPNDWGIYDTAGNVYEWCLDYCSWDGAQMTTLAGKVNVSATDPTKDYFGASGKTTRVLRGGCWASDAKSCRPTSRTDDAQTYEYYKFGFRVVCPLEAK